ncbi:MAG TPA: septum site-determining protein MinC [Anaerolineae bacterium]|nr:septum site-determining protein MinC [Anaerolineae bacterium]HOQ98721.1 septum site-determining protein MinC [Anaerolineae bacterium]HPL30101.1 septum site-determining protein MinC [Anaerolineae bacterium]
MSEDQVIIKGTRDGVALTIGEGPWVELVAGLETRLRSTAGFFKGARVLMDVGARTVLQPELEQTAAALARYDMTLVSVISTNAETQAAAREAGLGLVVPQPARPDGEAKTLPFVEGILLRRTLRSGQVARHEGHVAVIGDVNAGAEIIAGGDVIVWGKVRGIVHAGAMGDENAVVCALYLAPMQLRIGPHIARAPEGRPERPLAPEQAFVRDGTIVVEPWTIRD